MVTIRTVETLSAALTVYLMPGHFHLLASVNAWTNNAALSALKPARSSK
jgi:hypothetical protein